MTEASRGFTLLELLIALAVLGFVILEIGLGVDFGLRASTVQSHLMNRRADLDGVDRVLRYLVEHMDAGSTATPPQLTGTGTSFSFTTELPAGAVETFTRRVDVRLFVGKERQLILRWTPHLHSGDPVAATPSENVLLKDVDTVQFSYFYPLGAAGHGWTEQWSEPYLPRVVRIHLSFSDGDAQRWPDMIMEPAQDRPRE
jgi:prepilin-type N-terminal cleavage/methylation domain-containing protein